MFFFRFANIRSFYIKKKEQAFGIAYKVLYKPIQRLLFSYGTLYHFTIKIACRYNSMASRSISEARITSEK